MTMRRRKRMSAHWWWSWNAADRRDKIVFRSVFSAFCTVLAVALVAVLIFAPQDRKAMDDDDRNAKNRRAKDLTPQLLAPAIDRLSRTLEALGSPKAQRKAGSPQQNKNRISKPVL